ncbi:MAG: hypothetical protein RLZ44_1305 [Pseudomonadota bacterium]
MQALYQARDAPEAHLLADRLAAARIRAVVLGEHLAGAAGELPALNFPTVWLVDPAHAVRAQAVLAEFLAEQRAPLAAADPWICPACAAEVDGELDLCWNCGAERPA